MQRRSSVLKNVNVRVGKRAGKIFFFIFVWLFCFWRVFFDVTDSSAYHSANRRASPQTSQQKALVILLQQIRNNLSAWPCPGDLLVCCLSAGPCVVKAAFCVGQGVHGVARCRGRRGERCGALRSAGCAESASGQRWRSVVRCSAALPQTGGR